MPITPVDEYGYLGPPEQHVGSAGQTGDGQSGVHPVSETLGMDKTPNRNLGASIEAPLPLHTPQCFWTTGFRHDAD
jgi:hypothetical protein